MNTKVKSGEEARKSVLNGTDELSEPVTSTLGSKGRYVLISNDIGLVQPTKDGVTVATSISPKDKFARAAARSLHESAVQAVHESGDGTTTTTALAQTMIHQGFEAVDNGANPIDLRRGIDIAVKEVVDFIKSKAISVEDNLEKLKEVSVISANNDTELGELIAETVYKVTSSGVVKIEESQNEQTYVEFMKGTEIDSGFADEVFINNNLHQTVEYHDALIAFSGDNITNMQDILPVWEIAANEKKPLILIVGKLEGAAAATIVQNAYKAIKEKKQFNVSVIHAYGGGRLRDNYLEDLAIITGGKVMSESLGRDLSEVTLDDLGSCGRIVSNRLKTAIYDGNGNPKELEDRIAGLKVELKEEFEDNNKNILRERIAKLIGGVATLKVGGYTPLETKERAARCDDAVRATRSAIEEGIVAGGGITLLNAIDVLDTLETNDALEFNKDVWKGVGIVKKALFRPFEKMVQNAGLDPKKIVEKIGEMGIGYNLETDTYVDMVEEGIIDAAKVARVALESAASVSGILITTEHIITEDD